jgi:hypothetical protein
MASIRKMRFGVEEGLGAVVVVAPGAESGEVFFLGGNE